MVASISGKRTIVLKAGYNEGGTNSEEGILDDSAGISPGMHAVRKTTASLLGRHTYEGGATPTSGGTTPDAAVTGQFFIVKENPYLGETVDDAYANGENIFLHRAMRGDICQVLVLSGETITKGLGAKANADGKWISAAGANAVGVFLEASGGALAADTLMRVEFY